MGKKGLIILIVLIGVAIAVVLGVFANSQSVAESKYCNALDGLQSSIATLTSLDPKTASKDDVQTDAQAVKSAWGSVASAAKDVSDDNQESLQNAWNSFQSAVGSLTSGSGSAEDVESAATSLGDAVESSIKNYDCGVVSTTSSS